MNSSPPRVALVGCGGVARAHVRAVGAASVAGLCDANPDAARRLADEFGIAAPLFDSPAALLEAGAPAVVLVCTPPATHFAIVCAALEAGADVLCEKPLATRAADAHALVALATARGATLRTSAKYRFCAGVLAAQALIESGEAGALQRLAIGFGAPFDWRRSWHANTALSGGGVWMDNGPHALDLARFLAGELRFVGVRMWQAEGEVETDISVRFESLAGASVRITLSWERAFGDEFALINCERGVMSLGWHATLWTPHGAAPRTLAGAYDKAACFAAQWRAFEDGDARWKAEDGAQVVALLEEVYEAR